MESDYGKMLELIKEITRQTQEAAVPADIVIGEVVSTSPLSIQLESKLKLPAECIMLTKNTCLWSVDMDVDHHTENKSGGAGYAEFESHNHGYLGRKTYRVHNELAVGDKVYLLRVCGGQKYLAVDRVYNPDRGCNG